MVIQLNQANIVVTGGAGFMGSAFIRLLLKDINFFGTITNIDLLTYAGNLANLAEVEADTRYTFIQGDISNKVIWDQILPQKVDVIVHFAAETHVDRSIHDSSHFFRTNVLGTWQIMEWVRQHPHIHVHHISTDEVYGALGPQGCFTEESPYQPNSPYSASKASSDHIVHAWHKTYGLSVTISHASNNYGPYQFPEKFIPHMISQCMQKKILPIYGTGSNIRDWLYVDDHAEAIKSILKSGKSGEVYNIGGHNEKTNFDVLQDIIEVYCGIMKEPMAILQSLVTFVKDRPGHDYRYSIDISKIMRETGWQPKVAFTEGLYSTILWYLNNQSWVKDILNGEYRNWISKQYLSSTHTV